MILLTVIDSSIDVWEAALSRVQVDSTVGGGWSSVCSVVVFSGCPFCNYCCVALTASNSIILYPHSFLFNMGGTKFN